MLFIKKLLPYILISFLLITIIVSCGDDKSPTTTETTTIAGNWSGRVIAWSDTIGIDLVMQQNETDITGTASFTEAGDQWSASIQEGKFTNNKLTFTIDIREVDPNDNEQLKFSGNLNDAKNKISGDVIDIVDGQQKATHNWWVTKK